MRNELCIKLPALILSSAIGLAWSPAFSQMPAFNMPPVNMPPTLPTLNMPPPQVHVPSHSHVLPQVPVRTPQPQMPPPQTLARPQPPSQAQQLPYKPPAGAGKPAAQSDGSVGFFGRLFGTTPDAARAVSPPNSVPPPQAPAHPQLLPYNPRTPIEAKRLPYDPHTPLQAQQLPYKPSAGTEKPASSHPPKSIQESNPPALPVPSDGLFARLGRYFSGSSRPDEVVQNASKQAPPRVALKVPNEHKRTIVTQAAGGITGMSGAKAGVRLGTQGSEAKIRGLEHRLADNNEAKAVLKEQAERDLKELAHQREQLTTLKQFHSDEGPQAGVEAKIRGLEHKLTDNSEARTVQREQAERDLKELAHQREQLSTLKQFHSDEGPQAGVEAKIRGLEHKLTDNSEARTVQREQAERDLKELAHQREQLTTLKQFHSDEGPQAGVEAKIRGLEHKLDIDKQTFAKLPNFQTDLIPLRPNFHKAEISTGPNHFTLSIDGPMKNLKVGGNEFEQEKQRSITMELGIDAATSSISGGLHFLPRTPSNRQIDQLLNGLKSNSPLGKNGVDVTHSIYSSHIPNATMEQGYAYFVQHPDQVFRAGGMEI